MDNIKVNRFNQLPLIELEENKLFLLDQNKNDKDNLETFITKSITVLVSLSITAKFFILFPFPSFHSLPN
jgi:hypothetical protein